MRTISFQYVYGSMEGAFGSVSSWLCLVREDAVFWRPFRLMNLCVVICSHSRLPQSRCVSCSFVCLGFGILSYPSERARLFSVSLANLRPEFNEQIGFMPLMWLYTSCRSCARGSQWFCFPCDHCSLQKFLFLWTTTVVFQLVFQTVCCRVFGVLIILRFGGHQLNVQGCCHAHQLNWWSAVMQASLQCSRFLRVYSGHAKNHKVFSVYSHT